VLAGSTSARGVAPAPPAGAALDALSQLPVRSSIASQRIYFVMTDRYRNGDSSNDHGGIPGGRDADGFDPTDIGYFHGGDFKGMTGDCENTHTGLARLRHLGFTAVWVTPPVGQKAVQGDSAAYHGYWGLAFTNVDPHLGTNADFAAFVDCAHRLGLKVYMDIVVNHTADVVHLSPGGTFIDPSQKPYKTCKGKKFNPANYVKKAFPCLKASNMPYVPFVDPPEAHVKKPDWLNDVTKYHNRGDIEFSSCSQMCFEMGDFFGLDDLFTEQPVVWQGLADVYGSWIRSYKLDGFRVDTAKHVNAAFFRLWVPRIMAAAREAGVPDFEIFGEVTSNDAVELSAFVRDRGLPNVLDFPFQAAAAGFAAGGTAAQALSNRLQDDDYSHYQPNVQPTPVTFLGNHDIGRAALQIQQHGASAATLLQRTVLGYDVLYLLRGAAAVYYGDEVGIIGTGGDKQARQDLFRTQVDEWKTQERLGSPPIGSGSSFDVTENPIELRLQALAALRDANPGLARGATVIRRAQGNVLVVSRIDWAGKHEYVIAFNSGTSAANVSVSVAPYAYERVIFGAPLGPTEVNSEGSLQFDVGPLSTAVYQTDLADPVGAQPKPALKVGKDPFSALWRASAAVAGSSPISVSFAIKRSAKMAWQLLAADDTPPYRAFLDRKKFAKKQKVYVVAIARGLSGATAVSKVVSLVPRPK